MKRFKLLMVVAISATIGFAGCAPKDADIKAAIESKLKVKPDMSGTIVEVKNGIITLTGECKDEICKIDCEKIAQEVEGVKTVINHLTIAAPPPPPPPPTPVPPASLISVLDSATQIKIENGLKDFKGVTVEFQGEKAVLTGTVTKADKKKIIQMLSSAKVKSDVSKLIVRNKTIHKKKHKRR